MAYGIYSVADSNFFPGVVAAINSLRLHGCRAPLAIVDIGLDGWMRHYLEQFGDVKVLDIQPLVGRVRYTDVKSCEEPVMRHWAYKAFAIAHYDLFARFTFIDADFLPLCDLERELSPRIERGEFVSSADGWNTWGEAHREAIGVEPGTYLNVNAGFFSLDMAVHGAVIREWRDLMTRSRPFDLWYGDQGALNAILDKYCVPKTALDPLLWNQTWLNEELAAGDAVVRHGRRLLHRPTGQRIFAWHGCGWYKLWHQIGIDHFRDDPGERDRFRTECVGRSPGAVLEVFRELLFMDRFNEPLMQHGHRVVESRRGRMTPRQSRATPKLEG